MSCSQGRAGMVLSLLDENLNERVSYRDFFTSLGYKGGDTIYLRTYADTKATKEAHNLQVELYRFNNILPTLKNYNSRRQSICFVVNGGGQGMTAVKVARAQFMEIDEKPFEEQIRALNGFELEPSIIIKTRKSLHCYWLLDHGDIKQFRAIQDRLALRFGADKSLSDEAQVLRLYGFNHCKAEPPVMVKLIKFDPDLRYTQDQFDAILPTLPPSSASGTGRTLPKIAKTDGEKVPHGSHYYYVLSQIGKLVYKLRGVVSDEAILATVWSDYQENCEDPEDSLEQFHRKYLRVIRKFLASDARREEEFQELARQLSDQTRAGGAEEVKVEAAPQESAGPQNMRAFRRSVSEGFKVYLVGDKADAEALEGLHYVSTYMVGPWRREFAPLFKGANLVIIPDNDRAQEEQAEQISADLKKYAFQVVVLKRLSDKPGGNVVEFFTDGGSIDDFKAAVSKVYTEEGAGWIASWAYVNKQGDINIKPPALALNYSKVADYIIVRNPIDDNDLFYSFDNGVYRRWNKAQIKGAMREFVPLAYQKDNQIAEAQRTIFELGKKIQSFDDLDSDERYINFRNGLYDIEKKKLVPHDPKVLSTIQLGFDYDPRAQERPVFTKFMNDFFTREDGTIDFDSMRILQEFAGLAISNIYVYRAKKALFLVSTRGNTGKSVFMNLMQYILGEDNITSVPLQNMNEVSGRFTMGTALGKRMIINGDQTETDVTDSSYFKQLTGGDRTKMENKQQKPLMVRYRGGIMVGCNGLPSFTGDKGEHIFERLLIIMATNVIPQDKRDPELLDKMKPEVPAIVNWFLEGLHRLIDNNLKFSRSEAMDEAVQSYREKLDSVFRFIQEYRTESGERYELTRNRADQVTKTGFYEAYQAWCKSDEIDLIPVKKKNIDQRLEALGCEIDPRGNAEGKRGVYTIRGMKKEEKFMDGDDSELPF